ncbi:hypothetical protein [Corynebacterium cystitidis]|uniref:hypothetical protein n=1 Tax=Corynebacterium cystitidis TaxID=35757 RepID=UPI00211E4BE7|nr:hypothetical protein [Corynebacterium cystitidis]
MSDNDKQLTVAELLARAGKDNPDGSERPRRRRRRSLEEGGISVAELTGSFRKVEARPEEAKHSSVPIDAPEPAQKDESAQKDDSAQKVEPVEPEPENSQAPKSDETAVIEKVDDEPAAKQASAQDADQTSVMPAVKDEPRTDVAGTSTDLQRVELGEERDRSAAALAEDEVDNHLDDYESEEVYGNEESEENDEGMNIPALVGMILGGLILGFAVFFGFEWLWANLNAFVVAVLAVVVTVVMIGVVKALRTEKDGLMMTVAGFVGVLMTFGPALVTLL